MSEVRDGASFVRDAFRSRLWPLPTLAIVAAVALGVLLPHLDEQVDASLPSWLADVVFGGDAGAARTVLDAIASSLITVTSLTFSLTVVTLQLASSQFSPRLLRTFTSDLFVQATLGVFLATFTYALTVLRSVRGSDAIASEFVPRLSVTFAFLLAVVSVIMLVVFLGHVARQIRVENILRDVGERASTVVRATLPPRSQDVADAPPPVPSIPADATPVLAPASGFVVRIDADRLLEVCTEHDVVCVLDRAVGSSVVEGTPMGCVWSPSGSVADETRDALQARVAEAVTVGPERTAVQDVGYGLRQLTDVANKALSPGINDPTTAVHALGHISALLCDLAGAQLGPAVLTDDDGRARVAVLLPELDELVDAAITQPRRYGASDPQVMQRLVQLLGELAWRCDPDQYDVVAAELDRLEATIRAQDFDAAERRGLADAAAVVRSRIHQD